jgi:hypothetical protein
MSDQKKKIWFWTKTIAQGVAVTAVTFAPEIMQIFPEHTLVFKLALPAGFLLKYLFVRKDYKKDQLPSGITKLLDKIPDSITGQRGSTNERGKQDE